MALKTLKDLKIKDDLYYIDGNENVSSVKVTGITIYEIQFGNRGSYLYSELDETCFSFEAEERCGSRKPYYINKVTALKKKSSILNENLKSLFQRQKGVLERIESITNSILETNLEIVNETK